jgi:TRAP-type C4-dicarboxylate transport system permease small subunit
MNAESGSTTAGIIAAYDRLLLGLGALAGLVISAMAVLITLDVVLRNVGLANMPWLNELSEYALYVTTFIAAPWVLSLGSHVRVDLLAVSVPRAAARVLEIVADLLGTAISLTMGWYGLRVVRDGFVRGDLLYKEVVIPEWWLLAFIPLGCALLAIEFLRRLYRAFSGADQGADTPLAEGF